MRWLCWLGGHGPGLAEAEGYDKYLICNKYFSCNGDIWRLQLEVDERSILYFLVETGFKKRQAEKQRNQFMDHTNDRDTKQLQNMSSWGESQSKKHMTTG